MVRGPFIRELLRHSFGDDRRNQGNFRSEQLAPRILPQTSGEFDLAIQLMSEILRTSGLEPRTSLSEAHQLKLRNVKRYVGRRRRLAFLDLLLLNARDGKLSDADIREEVDTFMFAGQDTTAAAISFTVFLLSRHQDVQEKVLDELKSVFDPQQPLRPSLQQLSELKYLEMVVKESLRLYPPAPHINRWNPEDVKLASGHVMPEGSSISIVPYSIHRDPDVFPEPERFIPERFSPEESARRHPYAYIPFSAGPRNCIGQRFAMLEIKSILAKVLWNFRILPDPDFEPVLSWEIILVSVNGIQVCLEERS